MTHQPSQGAVVMSAVLSVLDGIETGNRTADYLIARALNLPLVNPFTAAQSMIEELGNEWLVAIGRAWAPLPAFTASTDAALSAASRFLPGVRVDIEEVGDRQFRAALHFDGTGRRHHGPVRRSRPLAVLRAAIELRGDCHGEG